MFDKSIGCSNSKILDENLEIFKNRCPEWINSLKNSSSDYLYKISLSKSGDPILIINKNGELIRYHSAYKPIEEAERLIKLSINQEYEVLIIAGLGFAYLAEEALKQFNSQVVIWDFDWFLLKNLIYYRSIATILNNPKAHLIFSENPQALIEILKSFQTTKIKLIIHKPSARTYPEKYNKISEAISHFKNSKEINIATLNRFERLWTRNILKNLSDFISYKGINVLENMFKGIPCVIVAAGPSLIKNIHLLKHVKGKGLIISVDTSFQVLQSCGIDPDFVIAVDPQDINKKYFEYLKPSKAILVVEPSISPKILQKYNGRKLILSSVFHLVKWFEKLVGEKGFVDIGGSVATAAYGLALKIGVNPIVFVGLDLAYSEKQTHMRGSYFEENWFYQWNRFQNNHSLTRHFLNKFNLFEIKGYEGKKIFTDRKFQMFRKWFEAKFKNSKITIINSSEGGALIQYCDHLPFKKVLDIYFSKTSNFNFLNKFNSINFKEDNSNHLINQVLNNMHELISALNFLHKEVILAKHLSNDLYYILLKKIKYSKELPSKVNYIYKKLDYVDQLIISDKTLNALISISIQSTINNISNNSSQHFSKFENKHSSLKVAKKSIILYEVISDSLTFNVQQFKKAVIRLKRRQLSFNK